MKVYFIYRNHWEKPIRTIHVGIDINVCFKSNHFAISISLAWITVGVNIYKPVIDINDPKYPWNYRK